MFCHQKSTIPSKITKVIMQIPQARIEKTPPKIREIKMIKTKLWWLSLVILWLKMYIYGWELSYREEKVVVKHFSGSTTEDMKTYIQSSLKSDPDRVSIHISTNDLRSSHNPENIAKNIIHIVKNSTTNKNKILVSSIVLRRDNLNGKVLQVNSILQTLYGKQFCLCEPW